MEPEEYRQELATGFGESARMVEQLGGVLLGVMAVVVALVVIAYFGGAILGLLFSTVRLLLRAIVLPFDAAIDLFHGRFVLSPNFLRWLLRRDWLRLPVAFLLACGSLAIGATGGLLQLDGGWCERPQRVGERRERRFWCRTPARVRVALHRWANPPTTHSPDIRAWAARQDRSQRYGQVVISIAAQILARDARRDEP